MTNNETLEPVLGLAHGKTIGGEPAFTFPEVLDVLSCCTKCDIAVLGIELFTARPEGYRNEGMSTYEVQLAGQSWHDFVLQNNGFAADFARRNRGGDDYFYLLTASREQEFAKLAI
jgi:hypothetical protein